MRSDSRDGNRRGDDIAGRAGHCGSPSPDGYVGRWEGPNGDCVAIRFFRPPRRRVDARHTASVALATCTDDPAWLCGSLPVPIDRADPAGRQISIGFTVFPHTDPTSTARDALVFSQDGPGSPSSGARRDALFVLGPLRAQRDLLLIDDRGTGTSAPIDCPTFQRDPFGRVIVIAAMGECGQQLRQDADRYGSGDIALDMEAVRSALGYPQITYYAPAYGTVHEQAYAFRFPHRVRAIVADSGAPVNDRAHIAAWGIDLPPNFARVAGLICQRAPACASAHPGAQRALAWLARVVRRHPVEGTAQRVAHHVLLQRLHHLTDQVDVDLH